MTNTVTTTAPSGETSRPDEDTELRVSILRAGSRDSRASRASRASNADSCRTQATRDTGTTLPTMTGPASTTTVGAATPARVRKQQQPPPPIPRRTDFGDYYPDGGWGWVVAGAAFLVHFLSHGLHLAFGTMLTEILTRFLLKVNNIVHSNFGMLVNISAGCMQTSLQKNTL